MEQRKARYNLPNFWKNAERIGSKANYQNRWKSSSINKWFHLLSKLPPSIVCDESRIESSVQYLFVQTQRRLILRSSALTQSCVIFLMMAMTTSDTQQVYGERYHLVRGDENNMNEVKMDSQETTSNAAESPSNRELNVVSYNFTNHRLKVCRNFNPSRSIDISNKPINSSVFLKSSIKLLN